MDRVGSELSPIDAGLILYHYELKGHYYIVQSAGQCLRILASHVGRLSVLA
jgi:hypothetical protein